MISSIFPHRERQGMQLVSSGYNPVLMQKAMKASDPMASGPLLLLDTGGCDDQPIH